jgi:GTP-binding protein
MQNFPKWLFAQECRFIAGCDKFEAMPPASVAEVAFAGRSNVGKSSLINKLTNRLSLARVSHTPGRTKQLNFFSLAEKVILVDLPGHGYAKASKMEIAGWSKLIFKYLQTRPTLKRLFLLIDCRHGIKEADHGLIHTCDIMGLSYQIVLTKSDKSTAAEINLVMEKIKEKATPAMHPEIIVTSSRYGGDGIAKLHQEIASFAA